MGYNRFLPYTRLVVFNLTTRDPHTRTTVLEPYSRTLCTEYEGYGVRRLPYFKGTELGTEYGYFFDEGYRTFKGTTFSTEYGDFFKYEVQGVRGTKSTKVRMRVPADDHEGMSMT